MNISLDLPKESQPIETGRVIIPSGRSVKIQIEFEYSNHDQVITSVNGKQVETHALTGQSEWAICFSANQVGNYTISVEVYGDPTKESEFEHLEQLKQQDAIEMNFSDSFQVIDIEMIVVESPEDHTLRYQKAWSIITDTWSTITHIVTAIGIIQLIRGFLHWRADNAEESIKNDDLKQEENEPKFEITTLDDFDKNDPNQNNQDLE